MWRIHKQKKYISAMILECILFRVFLITLTLGECQAVLSSVCGPVEAKKAQVLRRHNTDAIQ